MRITTLVRYLLGQRQAILDIAADRGALAAAAVLVLSAAFAREYDATYLGARWWMLLVPWTLSFVTSLAMWTGVYLATAIKLQPRPPFWRSYRRFLTLFWMTAPLAWLYAVPYERFLAPYEAVVANLWTLALVAAWRVALTTRVVAVLTGISGLLAFFLVAAIADLVAMVVVVASPGPIVAIMGGVQHLPHDQLLADVTVEVFAWGLLSLPLWVVGALVALFRSRPKPPPVTAAVRPAPSLWAFAAASILLWGAVLPFTQAEQRRAWKIDRMLAEERIGDGLAAMTATPRRRLPPHFDPRPRNWRGQATPFLLDVLDAVADQPPAPWVRQVYLGKLENYLARPGHVDWARTARLLARLPEGPALAARLGDDARAKLERHVLESEPGE